MFNGFHFHCSGGKDSCYNMMQCVAEGHRIVALANLRPENKGKGVTSVCDVMQKVMVFCSCTDISCYILGIFQMN